MITLPTCEESEAASDDLTATPLQRFIYNYEPGDSDNEWRKDLSDALDAARSTLAQKVLKVLETVRTFDADSGEPRYASDALADAGDALRELFQREGVEVKL